MVVFKCATPGKKKNYVWRKVDLKKKKARWMVKNEGGEEMGGKEWNGEGKGWIVG